MVGWWRLQGMYLTGALTGRWWPCCWRGCTYGGGGIAITVVCMTDSPLTPRVRLDAIPSYRPGKPPTPAAGLTSFKLSSNENPYDPLPGVVDAVTQAATHMNRYPNYYGQPAVDAIAQRYGVPAESVVLGPGSVGVLGQLMATMCEPDDEVVFAWRSFEAYPIVTQVASAKPVMVPLTAKGRHDLPAMAAAVTDRTRMVLVCTPNNPTGTTVTADELTTFLDSVPERVLVVIDEAYAEFVTATDVPDAFALFASRPNVAVLRTFSKAYGLAGMRVGYAVASPVLADGLRKTMVPFSVSDMAQSAVVASLASEDALLERVTALVAERERVVPTVREQGWEVPQTQGNFFWLPLGDTSAEFAQVCGENALTVRAFPGEGVRCTIGETEGNDRLIKICAEFAVR